MSLQKSEKKDLHKRDMSGNMIREKGSYTQEGFHRKSNQNMGMNLSNLSQKQSIYDQKFNPNPAQTNLGVEYSPLDPSNQLPSLTDPPKQQQYYFQLEYQLKRQREKNHNLQVRIETKQLFMKQMQNSQYELSTAFHKCQEELEYYKKKCLQPSIEAREYLQEINELKHLVIRLEDKITEYQKSDKQHYSSVKNYNSGTGETSKIATKERDSESRLEKVNRDKRSKTTANNQDSSPQIRKGDVIQDYVIKFPNRFTNFVQRFLSMVQFFSEQAQKAKKGEDKTNVKKRLKISWKWIKEVVGEWSSLKIYKQNTVNFHANLRKIFEVPSNASDTQAMQMILSSLS